VTPEEQSAYHNYPAYFAMLLRMAEGLVAMPLDELLSANIRAALTGTFMGPNGPEIVDVDKMAAQRRLIERFIAMRDDLTKERIRVVSAGTVPTGPPAPAAPATPAVTPAPQRRRRR
jgi:hypothetical protein